MTLLNSRERHPNLNLEHYLFVRRHNLLQWLVGKDLSVCWSVVVASLYIVADGHFRRKIKK